MNQKLLECLKDIEETILRTANGYKTIVNVSDYIESGKGAISDAIADCKAAGGGMVIIPEGEWLTGPIHLSSDMCLYIEDGAVVTFSPEYSDYLPVVFTRWEGTECYNYSPLIYANGCKNVAITGKGKLIGNGKAWWEWKKLQQAAADELCYSSSRGVDVSERVYGTEEAALRPSFIQTINCENVLIEGISIENGPQWTIHPVYSNNVIIRNVNIDTDGPNTDGINPDSCTNVLIEQCEFSTGDDCIAINSGMNEDGWRVNRPCRNIVIRKCVMRGGHGGIVIGSGMSGGVSDVYVSDCEIDSTLTGIRLKSMRGRGGYVRNIHIDNLMLNSIQQEAIQINMFYEASTVIPQTDTPSEFENIYISNIHANKAKKSILIKGLPEQKLDKITLKNIKIRTEEAMIIDDVTNLSMSNVNIILKDNLN